MPKDKITRFIIQFIILFGVVAAITELVRFRFLRIIGIVIAASLLFYLFNKPPRRDN